MIRKRYRGVPLWLWLLTAITLCFIWGNSMLPSTLSRAVVSHFKQLLKFIAPWLYESGGGNSGGGDGGNSTGTLKIGTILLRKSAHCLEYFLLGAELTLLLRVYTSQPWSMLALCGITAALMDETFQLFASGRSGEVGDMWIDLGGFLVGVVFVLLLRILLRCRPHKRI